MLTERKRIEFVTRRPIDDSSSENEEEEIFNINNFYNFDVNCTQVQKRKKASKAETQKKIYLQ